MIRVVWLVTFLLWLVGCVAVLLAVGAVAFARSHVRPWGPAGMAATPGPLTVSDLPVPSVGSSMRRTAAVVGSSIWWSPSREGRSTGRFRPDPGS